MYLLKETSIFSIRPALSMGTAILLLLSVPAAGDISKNACRDATYIQPTATFRSFSEDLDHSHCFTTHVGETGVFSIDVSATAFEPAQPRLDFVGRACGERLFGEPDFTTLERLADSTLVEIRTPGSYLFCVSAEDPSLPLGEVKVRTAFVEVPVNKIGDPNEKEPDPDLLTSGCPRVGDPNEVEPDPDLLTGCANKVGDPNEKEPDPDLLTGLSPVVLEALCLADEVDDHGDTRTCATYLEWSQGVGGNVRNKWGDDRDEFVFFVSGSGLRTVSIETTGDTDTVGTLFDRHGQRLQIDDDGGTGENFRIARTLVPGIYYLRVEGRHHSEGTYGLSLRSLSR